MIEINEYQQKCEMNSIKQNNELLHNFTHHQDEGFFPKSLFKQITQDIIYSQRTKYHQLQSQISANMQQRIQFYPDIETKFDHLAHYMNDKNQITGELVKILKDVCNLELFYSNSLDKFANSISKLSLGHDAFKTVLIILQRIIASKYEESLKLAKQIKDDLIPHIESSINAKTQQKLKQKKIQVSNIRSSMQRKIRMLFSSQSLFKKSVTQVNSIPKLMLAQQKQKILENYRKKQDQFSDTIDSYNSSLNDYMIKYSEICQEFIKSQSNRVMQYRDAVTKLVIFQIDYIKNLEYNFKRYTKQLEKIDGKFTIQDQGVDLGQRDSFYEAKDNGILHLGKISNKNYIDNIVGKKRVSENLLAEQIKVSELRSTLSPGQIQKQEYHSLVKTLFPILNFIHKNNHSNLLIEVVQLSKSIYMSKGSMKISLLNSLVCHQIFSDIQFWQNYEKRLLQKIVREQNSINGDEKFLRNNFVNVLQRDINMLLNVQINPTITKIINTVCERAKITIGKGQQNVKISGTSQQKKANKENLFKHDVIEW